MGAGRVLTGAGLAAMVAATVVALLANTSNPPSGQSASPELRVPLALAGIPITGSIRGAAACAEIDRLHGTTVAGTATFSAPRPQEVRGRTVFVTEGTGQVYP